MPRVLILLANERKAVGLVLGLPINMNGSEGPRAQSTRAFARNLARLCGLPIGLWDERLSTAAVERELLAADASRAKRAAVIDQHAAAYILQGALDRLAGMGGAVARARSNRCWRRDLNRSRNRRGRCAPRIRRKPRRTRRRRSRVPRNSECGRPCAHRRTPPRSWRVPRR